MPFPAPEVAAPPRLRYVLVTPARDEETYIERTLQGMVAQTVRPLGWVIVSDGSQDGTDDIVRAYAARFDWIAFLRLPDRRERHFGGKVAAFRAGAAQLRELPYDVIGNLDADVSLVPDHIEHLLHAFAQCPALGVVGTNYQEPWETRPRLDFRFTSTDEVPGACQLFRRQCFEAIGGYSATRRGGIDLLANLRARMHGWETRVCTERVLIHHRQQGTSGAHPWLVEFHNGRKDYLFGAHPLWQLCRATYRLTRKPYVIGGVLAAAGYAAAALAGGGKDFPPDVVEFRRREQIRRLRTLAGHLARRRIAA